MSNVTYKTRVIRTLGMYKGLKRTLSPFEIPQRLTKCKYELRMHKSIRKSITTDVFNREVILTEMVKWALHNPWFNLNRQKHIPYYIYVSENGVKELLLDSTNPDHQKFILSLCQQGNN